VQFKFLNFFLTLRKKKIRPQGEEYRDILSEIRVEMMMRNCQK